MMKTPEEIQTEMMDKLLRSKAKDYNKLRIAMGKNERIVVVEKTPISPRDPSETLGLVSKMLENNNNDEEFIKSMDLLIPVVLGMFSSSPHWLVRDKSIECLQMIKQKMGKLLIEKHLKTISKKKRIILEKFL